MELQLTIAIQKTTQSYSIQADEIETSSIEIMKILTKDMRESVYTTKLEMMTKQSVKAIQGLVVAWR